MIYKVDHISFVESRDRRTKVLLKKNNYKFKEQNLLNVDTKKSLMMYNQLSHDLFFYEDENMYWPTEVILYDRVGKDTEVTIENNCVCGRYGNLDSAIDFLSLTFGKAKVKVEGNVLTCNIKGVLDRKDYILKLFPNDDCKVYLDSAGYGTIALFANTIKDIPQSGVLQTKYESITVNQNLLQVCFVKCCDINIIFEFIKMERRK